MTEKSSANGPSKASKAERIEVKYPRRTQRRKRTRAAIESAAAKLFGETGYSAATMQAIADEADVHVTTLFTHFKTKADLALSLINEMTDQLRQRAFEARGQTSFFDFFREEADRFAALVCGPSGQNGLWSALRQDEEFSFAWARLEEEQSSIHAGFIAQEYGLDPQSDYRPQLAASLMLMSLFIPHGRWVAAGAAHPLKEELSRSVALAERGARALLEG